MMVRMTVDEALAFADEWSNGQTFHADSQGWRVVCMLLAAEVRRQRERIESAPVAIMDTRDALGICAPAEDDFPALYALQGKRVRLVIDNYEERNDEWKLDLPSYACWQFSQRGGTGLTTRNGTLTPRCF